MPKGLTKRKVEKRTEPPEPLSRLCEDVPTVAVKRDIVRCTECNREGWQGGLCYTHWKLSKGFVFDEEKKLFVKPKRKAAKTCHS